MTDQQKQQTDKPDQGGRQDRHAPDQPDTTRNRERPMDDPTRGRQGDPLEDALPHGGTTQGDRGGTG